MHRYGVLIRWSAALICTVLVVGATSGVARAGGFVGTKKIHQRSDESPAGTARAFSVRSVASGWVGEMNVYLDRRSTASEVMLGLYSDERRRPGRRLASCAVADPENGRWNACRFAAVTVRKRSKYWAVVLQPRASTGTIRFRSARKRGAPSYRSSTGRLARLPNTLRARRRTSESQVSLFARRSKSPKRPNKPETKGPPTPVPSWDPVTIPSSSLPPSPSPSPLPGEPAGVRLRGVDGGVGYYGKFASGLPSGADFFALGVWGSYDLTQANVSSDKGAGLNLYVWTGSTADNSNLANVRAAGMYAIHNVSDLGAFSSRGSESAGWLLADEIDMQQANAAGALAARQTLASRLARVPDGRAVYNNYGKGVAFWNSDSDAEQYVNDFQDLVSMDVYWHTDPGGACTQWEGGSLVNKSRALTEQECRRSSNYGWNVDRLRELDAMDGQRKPIWNFVELGCPFTDGDCITPDQVRSAVWHSIIAGARGLVYFNHSFGGPCQTHHVLRSSCYSAVRSTVTAVNAQIKQLAPVLNSPFADGYASSGSGVRVMTKKGSDGYYVFAGSTQAADQTAAIAVKTGTSATVLGENRSVPIVNGRISDTFADSNAIHIYKINP